MEGVPSPPLKLSASVAVFVSGSGGYLVIELQDRGLAAHVWWASKMPRLNVELWPTLDSWIAMGFDT